MTHTTLVILYHNGTPRTLRHMTGDDETSFDAWYTWVKKPLYRDTVVTPGDTVRIVRFHGDTPEDDATIVIDA